MNQETVSNALELMCVLRGRPALSSPAAASSDELAAFVCEHMSGDIGLTDMAGQRFAQSEARGRALLPEAVWLAKHRGTGLAALPAAAIAQLALLAAAVMKNATLLSRRNTAANSSRSREGGRETVLNELRTLTSEALVSCSQHFKATRDAPDGFSSGSAGEVGSERSSFPGGRVAVMTGCLEALLPAITADTNDGLLLKTASEIYSCIGCVASDFTARKRFELFTNRLLAPTLIALETAGASNASTAILGIISSALFVDDDDRAVVELTSVALEHMGELLEAEGCFGGAKSRASFYTAFYTILRKVYSEMIGGCARAVSPSGDFGHAACALYKSFAAASMEVSRRPPPQGLGGDSWQLRASHKHISRLLHACFLVGRCFDSAVETATATGGKKRKISGSGGLKQLLRRRLLQALSEALHSSQAPIPHHESMVVYVNALKSYAADALVGILHADSEETLSAHLDTLRVLGGIDHRTLTEARDGEGALRSLLAAPPLNAPHSAALLDSCRALLLTILALYQQLRRLDDFVLCYCGDGSDVQGAMVSLLSEKAVSRELTRALQTIPVGQVDAVWSALEKGRSSRAQQLLTLTMCSSRAGLSDSLAFAPLPTLKTLLDRATAEDVQADASAMQPLVAQGLLALAGSMLNRSYAVKETDGWSTLIPPVAGLVSRMAKSPTISLVITALKFVTTYDVYFGSSDSTAEPLLPLLERQLQLSVQRASESDDTSAQATVFCLITRSFLVYENLLEGELSHAFRLLLDGAITQRVEVSEVNKDIFLESAAASAALAGALSAAVAAASAALPSSRSKSKGAPPAAAQRLSHLLSTFGDCFHDTDEPSLSACLDLMAAIAVAYSGADTSTAAAAPWMCCLRLLAMHVAGARSGSFSGCPETWLQLAIAATPDRAFAALVAAAGAAPSAFPLEPGDGSSALLAHLAALTDMVLASALRSPAHINVRGSEGYVEVIVSFCADTLGADSSSSSSSNVAAFTLLRAVSSCVCSLDIRQLPEETPAMFSWLVDAGIVSTLLSTADDVKATVSRRSLALLLLAECLRLRVKLAIAAAPLLLQAEALVLSFLAADRPARPSVEPEAWLYLGGVTLLAAKVLRRPLSPGGLLALCSHMSQLLREQVREESCSGSLAGGQQWHEESAQVFFRALIESSPANGCESLYDLLAELARSPHQRSIRIGLVGAAMLLECRKGRADAVLAACRCIELGSSQCAAETLRHLCTSISSGIHSLNRRQAKAAKTAVPGESDPALLGGLSSLVGSVVVVLTGLGHRLASLGSREGAAALPLLELMGQLFALQAQLPVLNNSIGVLALVLKQCIVFAMGEPATLAAAYGRAVSHCMRMLASSTNLRKHLYLFATLAIDTLANTPSPAPEVRDGLVSGVFALFEKSHPQDRQRIHKLLAESGRSALADINATYVQEWKFLGRA